MLRPAPDAPLPDSSLPAWEPLRLLLHPYALLLLVTLTVWCLDGYDIGPVNDGWTKLGTAAPATLGALFDFRSTEIFTLWPYARSIILATGGFQVLQIAMLAFTLLRGILWYEVVKRFFPSHPYYALACGLAALFHPFDGGLFWVGALGVYLPLVWALALCLVSLQHLETGSRASWAAMLALQIIYCCNYPAYLFVVLALPVGAWLLRRIEGRHDSALYLLKISVPVVACVSLQYLFASRGVGREGSVLDVDLRAALAGYGHAAARLIPAFTGIAGACRGAYLWLALPPALFAAVLVLVNDRAHAVEVVQVRSRAFQFTYLGGLIALALLAYLPYAFSLDRFGDMRQLLLAGIFIYALLLYVPFVILPTRWHGKRLATSLLLLFTALTVVTGLEGRRHWVDGYRAEERLLAALSVGVPHPAPGSFLLVELGNQTQSRELAGFYNNYQAFGYALNLLYGDMNLRGAITEMGHEPFTLAQNGVTLQAPVRSRGVFIPYGQLIVLDYSEGKPARLLNMADLMSSTEAGAGIPVHTLGSYTAQPGMSMNACSLLEKGLRPDYCR